MTDSWDDYADEWDSNEDAILYSKKAFKTLVDQVSLVGLNVLDFGCGTGLLTEQISPLANNIVALDTSKEMVSVLNNKNLPNVTTLSEPLSEDTVNTNTSLQKKFNLIVASSVLGFIPEYKSTLIILKSLLASDGILVQWDWLSPSNESGFGLSEEKVESAYKEAGFKLISIKKPFSLTSSKGIMTVLMAVAKNA
ncbi:MAG: class I SAM-dependent methyltransferase [Gammaproteobacteria bacterium]|jgi:predicted TPR repeat methyltransferase